MRPTSLFAGALLAALIGSACREGSPRPASSTDPASTTPPTTRRAPPPRRYRTVLIQLDGMPHLWLERWLRERRFLPGQPPADPTRWARGGFHRLARGARASGLRPTPPSLTAPNLTTMLTGALPATHGILANRYFRRGKRVVGFREPIRAELLWQAAERQQRRVVTWMAMGTRCAPPTPGLRRAVCYPMGRVRPARHTVQVDTRTGGTLSLAAALRAPGRHRLDLGVLLRPDGRVSLTLPTGARFRAGKANPLAVGDARHILWPGGLDAAGLPAPRRLSIVTLRAVDLKTGRVTFHDGGTAANLAAPPAFARTLDDLGLIRAPFADTRGLRSGSLSPRLFARTALRDVAQVARFARWLGRGDRFDVALIHISTVDELGHGLFAPVKRAELTPKEARAFHAALEWALRETDRHLATLIQGLDPTRTRIVLASDHGMHPVEIDVSLRATLHRLDPRIRVVTSGASGFVHLPEGVTPTQAAAHLRRLRVKGTPVFAGGLVATRSDFRALGLPDHAADLFVQAGPRFTLSYRRRRTLTGWPTVMATHGHRSDHSAMQGVLLLSGPGLVRRGALGPVDMIQVAPLVARAASITPPRQAAPSTLRVWKP